jgi:hypothetical protein
MFCFFTLKISKKSYISSRRFWVLGLFFMAINEFNKVFKVFSKYFRLKISLFIKKSKTSLFNKTTF